MIKSIGVTLVLLLALSACATMQATSGIHASSEHGMRVLSRYPPVSYKSLGTFNVSYRVQPGSHAPSLTDALPSLKAKASSMGGNELIVRDRGTCWGNRWCTTISAEALRVDWPAHGNNR